MTHANGAVRFDGGSAPLPNYNREAGDQQAAALKERPGEWALLVRHRSGGGARTHAYEIRHASRSSFAPSGAFEAEAKRICGEFRVYARFVGES